MYIQQKPFKTIKANFFWLKYDRNLKSMYVSQIIRKVVLPSIEHKDFGFVLNFQLSPILVLKYILRFKVCTQNSSK